MYFYRIGASIVVLTKLSQLPVFSQLWYNPQCFLFHQNLHNPFSDIRNVSIYIATSPLFIKVVLVIAELDIQ